MKYVSSISLLDFSIVGRQNNDINLINEVLSNSFNIVIRSLAYSVMAIIILLVISPPLVGILFVGLSVLCIFSGGLRRVTSSYNQQYLKEKEKLAQISEEVFTNIRTVKAFHNDATEIEKYRKINERVVALGKRRAAWSGIFQVISYALMYGTLVAITFFGAKISVANPDRLSPGMLVFFLFLLLSVIANVVMLALNLGPIF